MRSFLSALVAMCVLGVCVVPVWGVVPIDPIIIIPRGDANIDGQLNVSDSAAISAYLFNGGTLDCVNNADVNNDGSVSLSDITYLNNYLFFGGSPPPGPYGSPGDCGVDDGPDLGCDAAVGC